jgi:hypothetical protein
VDPGGILGCGLHTRRAGRRSLAVKQDDRVTGVLMMMGDEIQFGGTQYE